MLGYNSFIVLLNFGTFGIVLGPIQVGLEAQLWGYCQTGNTAQETMASNDTIPTILYLR